MIVLFGATGSIGPQLVRNLTARGATFRVAARNLDAARARLGNGLSFVQADVERPETLELALDGASAVFDAVGGATGTRRLAEATSGLIDAAANSGVQHFVHVSGVRSRPEANAEIQRVHGQIEQHLAASKLAGTVLRGNFFYQNFLGLAPAIQSGVLPLPTGAARAALVDARDIGDAAAAVLMRGVEAAGTYTMTGPESLSHADAAAIIARVLRRPVAFVDIPARAFEQSCAQAGLPAWFAFWLADVYEHAFAAGEAAEVSGDVEALTGARPRSLEQFVQDHRGAFGV